MNQSKIVISMSFPKEVLKQIDALANAEYTSRSDYIRQTMIHTIKQQKKEDKESAWNELIEGVDTLGVTVKKAGYETEKDFARLAKEAKQDRQPA